jgi:Zn ribbon nucleic-acid-binding protein
MPGAGAVCPNCGKKTWHETKAGIRACSKCKTVGWRAGASLTGGGGTGATCPQCHERCFMKLADLANGWTLRRCTECLLVAILPPGKKQPA